MRVRMPDEPPHIDYRFSLANERTFLAWIRTALALIAGGVAAGKAIDFNHELVRWVIAAPPVVAGVVLGGHAVRRWRGYEEAMSDGHRLPIGRGLNALSFGLAAYGVIALAAIILD